MPTRAAIYARVSGDDSAQNGRNITGQLDMARTYAEQRGYTVVAEYAEDSVSGAALDAPQLQLALEHARQGLYHVLIVREMDRLARDLVKQMLVESQLKDAGVRIEYVLGEYPDTPEGTLNRQIRAVIAEFERQKITERSIRGRRASSRAGHVLGGRAPYGYRFTPDHLHFEIDEVEAAVIRDIFTWYVTGDETGKRLSSRLIAEKLTALSVPTWVDRHLTLTKSQSYARWGKRRIMAIIRNETYAGTFYYGRANGGKRNPREHWIAVSVPAIIDRDLWEAAQRTAGENWKTAQRVVAHEYLLQGHIKCGECGATAYAATDSHGPRPYSYYRCGRRVKQGKAACDLPGFRVEAVDVQVWAWIKQQLLEPEYLQAGIEGLQREAEHASAPIRLQLETVKRQHKTTKAKLDRLLDLYLVEDIDQGQLAQRNQDLTAELDALATRQATLEDDLALSAQVNIDIKNLDAFAQAVEEELTNADYPTRRNIVESMRVQTVLFHGRRVESSFQLLDRDMSYKFISISTEPY